MHPYDTLEDLPRIIPVFPLSGALLLPSGRLPLNIFEPRYLSMIDDALAHTRVVGMIQPRNADDPAAKPVVYSKGCVGRLTSFTEAPDGRYLITLTGVCRFEVREELDTVTAYRQFAVDYDGFGDDIGPPPDEHAIDRETLTGHLRSYLEKFSLQADWDTIHQAPLGTLINSLAMICPFEPGEKQALLEAETLKDRADALTTLLTMALAGTDDDVEFPVQ